MATARKGPGRGRLPSLENLVNKSPDDLIRTLDRFGLAPDLTDMNARADKAFDRLSRVMMERGNPDAAAWEAIDRDIEKEMAQWLRQQVKTAINGYKLSGKGPNQLMTWVGVGDMNMCESCESRHGQTRKLSVWRRLGLPGSAVLVCRKECRCGLHPE